VTHLVQGGTETANDRAQDDRTESEGRILVISKIDKIPGDVSSTINDWFPFNILRLFICILEVGRFIQIQ
jgi:hypothetical protein